MLLLRGAVALFSVVLFTLGVLPFAFGCVMLNRGSKTFMATPVPTYIPWAVLCAGLILFARGVSGMRGACSPRRKLSLALTMIVTMVMMVLSGLACALTFEVQKSFADTKAHNVIVGSVFRAIRHRFDATFSTCQPTARASGCTRLASAPAWPASADHTFSSLRAAGSSAGLPHGRRQRGMQQAGPGLHARLHAQPRAPRRRLLQGWPRPLTLFPGQHAAV